MSLWSSVQGVLPQHAISRVVGGVANSRFKPLAAPLVRWFVKAYDVDLSDAVRDSADQYDSFNDLFTRTLRTDARPLAGDEQTVISPVDGTLSEFGPISDDRLVQAKGKQFTLGALLAGQAHAERYRDGHFATIYLAPYNYHRIHMPSAGRVEHMTLVPGRLFSVNTATAADVDNLFARNERVVTHIATQHSHYALIAVGALNVGSIETEWHGVVTPNRGQAQRQWDYDDPSLLERGAPWGHFNLGSTVILLWPSNSVELEPTLETGQTLRLGQAIARLRCV
ncbi:MAG: archaetidylserine decarboxylase [Gammaproteobacteria bacterium]